MFDSVTLGDHTINPSNGVHPGQLRQPSPTATSAAADRQGDSPQTYEGLLAANASLKTRVSELELINGLFRGRVAELEQSDATARRSEMIVRDSEVRLRRSLEEAQHREEDLKRRVSELERQVSDHSGLGSSAGNDSPGEPMAKRMRMSDAVRRPFAIFLPFRESTKLTHFPRPPAINGNAARLVSFLIIATKRDLSRKEGTEKKTEKKKLSPKLPPTCCTPRSPLVLLIPFAFLVIRLDANSD